MKYQGVQFGRKGRGLVCLEKIYWRKENPDPLKNTYIQN